MQCQDWGPRGARVRSSDREALPLGVSTMGTGRRVGLKRVLVKAGQTRIFVSSFF